MEQRSLTKSPAVAGLFCLPDVARRSGYSALLRKASLAPLTAAESASFTWLHRADRREHAQEATTLAAIFGIVGVIVGGLLNAMVT